MSPEALEGLRVDHRSDVYSAGLVLYVMLAGVGPFDRLSWQDAATGGPRAPSVLSDADLPPELDRIVLKAIEEAPGHRYQSASEFQRDVDALRTQLKQEL
jgi:serine/threonine-protein kinase